jgi:flagellar biosynthetic protein FlhB
LLGDIRPYPPTPRKREEARRRGHVPHSRDLSVAAGLAAGVVTLWLTGPLAWGTLGDVARRGLSDWRLVHGDAGALASQAGSTTVAGLLAVAPAILATVAATAMAHLLQTGFFLGPPARPEGLRFDTGAGLSRLLSIDGLAAVISGALKLVGMLWATLGGLEVLADAKDGTLPLGLAIGMTATRAVVAIVALGALDYGYRILRFESQMRMTRAELEAELRETEGHPITRTRRRR